MAELPEINKICIQMNHALRSKEIRDVALIQEKCSNVSADVLKSRCIGAQIASVKNKGKWIIISLENAENILISLGMGGDLLSFDQKTDSQQKYQIMLTFKDGSGFTIRYWWFGKFLIASDSELQEEPNTKDIAMHPFAESFSYDYFRGLFAGKTGQIKAFLMDQKNISGIGNMYMHDILFKSRLHPQKKISQMTENDFTALYQSIHDILRFSDSVGAFAYESDFYGSKGGFTKECFLVGYKENEPCPQCGEKISLIKTGSTSTFICPQCQKQ